MSEAVQPHANAIDADAVDALESLDRTWRTQIAGIYYETKPVNPIAADIYERVQGRVEDIRERMKKAEVTDTLSDATILGVLVFLQRVAFGVNNGRPKCKAFLVFLQQFYVDMKKEEEESDAALGPDEPLVIL